MWIERQNHVKAFPYIYTMIENWNESFWPLMSETPETFELRPNNKSRLFTASRNCYVTIGSDKMNHDAIYLKNFIQPCKSMSNDYMKLNFWCKLSPL